MCVYLGIRSRVDCVNTVRHVVITLESVAERYFCLFKKCDSTCTFFGESITFVFRIHVSFCEITHVVFKIRGIQ